MQDAQGVYEVILMQVAMHVSDNVVAEGIIFFFEVRLFCQGLHLGKDINLLL